MIKSNNSIKKISYIYFISLIPLIIYGFYKNGINLYMRKYVNLYGMFKPLIFVILGALIGIIVNIIYDKIKKSNRKMVDSIFSSFHIIYGILIACISSINTNLLLFSCVTFIVLFISKFVNFNKLNVISLTSLIIFLIMTLLNKFTFLNAYESSANFNMDAIDYLFGKGSGGIFTTNIILICISFIILYTNKAYKKVIPIYATITFSIFTIIYCIIQHDIAHILEMIFTNGILFSFVFIASESTSSSYTKTGQIIYGILVGILTFVLYLIQPELASLGAIFIASILSGLIDLKFE